MGGSMLHILVDGDMIIFKAAVNAEVPINWWGDFWTLHADAAEAKAEVDDMIVSLVDKVLNHYNYEGKYKLVLCFTDPKDNFRKHILPTYKANRKDTRKPMIFPELKDWCFENYDCVQRPKLEADDCIGILATKATVASKAYVEAIQVRKPDLTGIYQQACPAFVPLIEEGIVDNNIMTETIKYYLDDFVKENNIDTLVLGCTHYQLIRKKIEELYPGIRIISSSEEVVTSIGRIMSERDMLAGENDEENFFYASDLSENFVNMIKVLLGSSQDELNIRFKSLDM